MWMSYLIDGLDDGRFAVYVKVHHTVVDGLAGLQMFTDGPSTVLQYASTPLFPATHRAHPGMPGRPYGYPIRSVCFVQPWGLQPLA